MIRLGFRTVVDREWLALGQTFLWVRLMAQAHFEREGGLALVENAILDTGSPMCIIPRFVWQQVRVRTTGQQSSMGAGLRGGEAEGELGFVSFRVGDSEHVSPRLTARALLLRDDSAPLILGFGDLLTVAGLRCNFAASTAYLDIPLHTAGS